MILICHSWISNMVATTARSVCDMCVCACGEFDSMEPTMRIELNAPSWMYTVCACEWMEFWARVCVVVWMYTSVNVHTAIQEWEKRGYERNVIPVENDLHVHIHTKRDAWLQLSECTFVRIETHRSVIISNTYTKICRYDIQSVEKLIVEEKIDTTSKWNASFRNK